MERQQILIVGILFNQTISPKYFTVRFWKWKSRNRPDGHVLSLTGTSASSRLRTLKTALKCGGWLRCEWDADRRRLKDPWSTWKSSKTFSGTKSTLVSHTHARTHTGTNTCWIRWWNQRRDYLYLTWDVSISLSEMQRICLELMSFFCPFFYRKVF